MTAIKGRAVSYWKGVSLPYPESGIRLIRRDAINAFDNQITSFQGELEEAVCELNNHYSELRESARNRLGDLFDASDYTRSLMKPRSFHESLRLNKQNHWIVNHLVFLRTVRRRGTRERSSRRHRSLYSVKQKRKQYENLVHQ